LVNLGLAVGAAPELLKTLGSTIRKAGIVSAWAKHSRPAEQAGEPDIQMQKAGLGLDLHPVGACPLRNWALDFPRNDLIVISQNHY
jgi:hypothetical protein